MSDLPQFPFARRSRCVCLLLLLTGASPSVRAQTPTSPAPPPASPPAEAPQEPPKPQAPAANDSAEVSSRDTAPTFKVRVNLVLVRVVVRDQQGKVVPNLHKEDFQLSDNRKQQIISTFSVETPESRAVATTTSADPNVTADPEAAKAVAAALPQRFVSVVFDDQHLTMQDAMFVRTSAGRFFDSLAASDRVGIYSTSGQFTQEFTDDHELLRKSLLKIIPHSPTAGIHDCPEISYYEADLIENKNDPQALAIAAEDAVQCAFGGDETQIAAARSMAQATAVAVVGREDSSTEYALRHMEEVMRRLATMPGQRIMVFVSPGFITSTLHLEFSNLVDRATKANIVVNTIDARGLYTPDMGDIAEPATGSYRTAGYKTTYAVAAQLAQEDVLAELADGTGGIFFHNRNDVDEGLREAGAAPAMTYLIGFSPQNLKLDGSLHTLKVSFVHKTNYRIQARHAYFAPRHVVDPTEAAKQEIQEALFSQDEVRDLPVDLHTQFFKTANYQAKLAVLTHVDIKGVHFRKAEGRNRDDLTVATAIFDENGNYVTGGEKIVQMKLLDLTYDRLSLSGLNLKTSFDVKPGTYLVRQVVRDSEGSQLAARNGAVVIPN
ncbi:MAG TPA: VWA domain-containing protein [Candidatus Cybelea sp.]|jgi:VWFA-related protein|nr:VWA domain-containing protein [Candidatus Cybelea sp.]